MSQSGISSYMFPRVLLSSEPLSSGAGQWSRSLQSSPILPHRLLRPAALSLNLPGLFSGIWDSVLRAVPKKKTSHMKKRHRQMAGKALKDLKKPQHLFWMRSNEACSCSMSTLRWRYVLCLLNTSVYRDWWVVSWLEIKKQWKHTQMAWVDYNGGLRGQWAVKTESWKSRIIGLRYWESCAFIQLGYRVCCMAFGVWFGWRAIVQNFFSCFASV